VIWYKLDKNRSGQVSETDLQGYFSKSHRYQDFMENKIVSYALKIT